MLNVKLYRECHNLQDFGIFCQMYVCDEMNTRNVILWYNKCQKYTALVNLDTCNEILYIIYLLYLYLR